MGNEPKLMKSEDGKLFLYTPEYDTVKEKLESKWFQDDRIFRFVSVLKYEQDFVDDLVKICTASILSDNTHQEEETIVAKEICRELSINWDDFNSKLKNQIADVEQLKLQSIKYYLVQSKFGLHTKNPMHLFEAALHIVLADGIMTEKESILLADIAELLGIPVNKIISRISQFLRFEREILVDVSL